MIPSALFCVDNEIFTNPSLAPALATLAPPFQPLPTFTQSVLSFTRSYLAAQSLFHSVFFRSLLFELRVFSRNPQAKRWKFSRAHL